ncbi:MAG: hypothetical protein ACSHX5_05075 [Phycisphaerales bacterium]
MKLKTYTAETMAQALAEVRKDLGTDAMILHTRSFRTGSWLGLGGKPMVEITASSPQPTTSKPRKTRKAQRSVSEPVITEPRPIKSQNLQENHVKHVADLPDIIAQKPVSTPAPAPSTQERSQEHTQQLTEVKASPEPTPVHAHTDEAMIEASVEAKIEAAVEATNHINKQPELDDRSMLLQGLMGLDRKNPTISREPISHEPKPLVTEQPQSIQSPAPAASTHTPEPINSPIFSDEFKPTTFKEYEPAPAPKAETRLPAEPPKRTEPITFEPEQTLTPSDEVVFEQPLSLHDSITEPASKDSAAPTPSVTDRFEIESIQSLESPKLPPEPIDSFEFADSESPLDELDESIEYEIEAVESTKRNEIESIESALPSDTPEPVLSERTPVAPERVNSSTSENNALKAEIKSLKAMMGQVLDSTRRTAVAVNKSNPDAMLPSAKMSAPLNALYTSMIDNDVSVELADQFAGAVRDRLDKAELENEFIVRHAMLSEIESSISTISDSFLAQPTHQPTNQPTSQRSSEDRPHVIALIGPTGVGKTTTVAKLAATAKLRHGKKVALITSDTYRIAAVEQLRTYASIIGLELKIANSPEEIQSVIASLTDVDLIVIDTAGRSQNNHSRLDELGKLIEAAQPDETHLVLSSTVGENVLRKTAERFRDLGPDRCILTKIDEAVTTGMIAGIGDRIGLPLSFVTVGQEVPDDILPARADRLARAVLDGPDAVIPTTAPASEPTTEHHS